MNMPIFYVEKNKNGGVKGKLAFALLDYLLNDGKRGLPLESDTSNPDVYNAHHQHENGMAVCKDMDLDISDGWTKPVNAADEFLGHCLVIHSAARSNTGIAKYGSTLRETLAELNRSLVTFWVINRQRDSVGLLPGLLNAFPHVLIHVCRNLHCGEPKKFELYSKSKSREIIERKGRTLDFSDLGDRVADKLYSGRMSIKRLWRNCPSDIARSCVAGKTPVRKYSAQFSMRCNHG